jgi:hypothetical protein
LTLTPGQITEIEIPVAAAAQGFGVTFMANALVSATLLDEKGSVVGKNLAGTPESSGFFRTIFDDRAVTAVTWRLRLENKGRAESPVIIAAWSKADSEEVLKVSRN